MRSALRFAPIVTPQHYDVTTSEVVKHFLTYAGTLELAGLAASPPLSLVVKMDTEGSEWATLEAMTDDDFQQMIMLDLEVHWCMPRHAEEMGSALKRRIERQMSRLHRLFYVTERFAETPKVYEQAGCFDPSKARDGDTMMSLSYVNKRWVQKELEILG
jgi:hypothetical protein